MVTAIPALVGAQGEHARRAGAELLVLQGDLRKLTEQGLPERQIQGLLDRSRGSLAALPLLLRLADQETGRESTEFFADSLSRYLEEFDPQRLQDKVADLVSLYPFDTRGLLGPAPPSRERLEAAARQHDMLCAPCHDNGPADSERPAFKLNLQSRSMPAEEFAARMVVGIRGDRITGLDNPFSDYEIEALIGLYATGAPAGSR